MAYRNPGTGTGDVWEDPYRSPRPGEGGGGGTTGGGGGATGGQNVFTPTGFDFGSFSMAPWSGDNLRFDVGDVPTLKLDRFNAPGFEEATNDPGYQLRLQAGQQALERSAAARGLGRTGGTLKDLLQYGQNFAANEYQNVFNRAQQTFGTNQNATQAEFNAKRGTWERILDARQREQELNWQRQFDVYNSQRQGQQFMESQLGNILGQIGAGGSGPLEY